LSLEGKNMAQKAVSTAKEMLVSLLGIAIAIILAVLALGIANWAIDIFNITEEFSQAAALIAVALIIGPAIKAFATKKYWS
jgi:hypothetical protein